jgi:hypothetical protein
MDGWVDRVVNIYRYVDRWIGIKDDTQKKESKKTQGGRKLILLHHHHHHHHHHVLYSLACVFFRTCSEYCRDLRECCGEFEQE